MDCHILFVLPMLISAMRRLIGSDEIGSRASDSKNRHHAMDHPEDERIRELIKSIRMGVEERERTK